MVKKIEQPRARPSTFSLTSDHSYFRRKPKGLGSTLSGKVAQGRWKVIAHTCNRLELMVAQEAILAFAPLLQGRHVRMLMDNRKVVAYVSNQGGTRSLPLLQIVAQIFHWEEGELLPLTASYLQGVENMRADTLSRHVLDWNESMSNPKYLLPLFAQQGTPEVDLMASPLNAQLPMFFYRFFHPEARGQAALSQCWGFQQAYIFPPTPLILKTLLRIRQEGMMTIVIAPFGPNHPWFPLLNKLLIAPPVALLRARDLLLKGGILHPNIARLNLMAWLWKGAG